MAASFPRRSQSTFELHENFDEKIVEEIYNPSGGYFFAYDDPYGPPPILLPRYGPDDGFFGSTGELEEVGGNRLLPPPPPGAGQLQLRSDDPFESRQPLALQFSDQLDRIDRNWRTDPFWRDLYPRWAEPIFKEGIDVKANIVNDRNKFAVDIDAYQFKPEELQVKTLDDTVVIEGRHEDVRDQDNFTKMYFIRKYQLPADVTPEDITSRIDGTGRLTVEAVKRAPAIENSERLIPIEGPSRRAQSRSSSYSPREEAARAASSARNGDTGYHSSAFRNESRQSNYSTAQDRYGGYDPGFKNGYSSSPAPPPPPPPPVSAPAPPLGSDYRRNELNSRVADSNGFREERRREEYRSESRNGFHRSTSALGRPESSSGWRSDRDYRVESPRSGNGTTVNVPVNVQGPTTSSSSSRTAERNVRILTKSFE